MRNVGILLSCLLALTACDSVRPAPQNSTAGLSPAEVIAKAVESRSHHKGDLPVSSLPRLSNKRTQQELGEYVKVAIGSGRAEWKRLLNKPELPDWKVELLTTSGQAVQSPCNDKEGNIILQVRGRELFPFAFCAPTSTFYVALPLLQQLMTESGFPVQSQHPGLFVALFAEQVSEAYFSELGLDGKPKNENGFFFSNCVAGALAGSVGLWPPQWQIIGALDLTGVYDRTETNGSTTFQDGSVDFIGMGHKNGLGACIRYFFK